MQQPRQFGRRRSSAETIEPTLPLDMPRAEKPEPRPTGGRRGPSMPKGVETDLFGDGHAEAEVRAPSGSAPVARTRRAGRRAAASEMPEAEGATGPASRQPSAPPSGIAAPAPDAGNVVGPGGKRRRGGRTSVQPLPDPAVMIGGSDAVAGEPIPPAGSQPPDGPAMDRDSAHPDVSPGAAEDGADSLASDPVMTASPATATGATLLAPDEVLLQRVDPRSFRPNERSDSWLYWLTDRARADEALRNGVPIEPDASVVLADRRAVLPRLAELAEDPDVSPTAIAVLRLRRITVEPFLRPGPEPACYVLAGEAKVSA